MLTIFFLAIMSTSKILSQLKFLSRGLYFCRWRHFLWLLLLCWLGSCSPNSLASVFTDIRIYKNPFRCFWWNNWSIPELLATAWLTEKLALPLFNSTVLLDLDWYRLVTLSFSLQGLCGTPITTFWNSFLNFITIWIKILYIISVIFYSTHSPAILKTQRSFLDFSTLDFFSWSGTFTWLSVDWLF